MVALSKSKNKEFSTKHPSKVPVHKRTGDIALISSSKCKVPLECKQKRASCKAREIDPSLIVKTLGEPIGSGTFGDCFLAEYRSIKVVVKEMKRRDKSLQETERCKKDVLHEAEVLNSLGDHKGLPFLLGICTDKEPFSLVIQFHGSGEENLTLHKAIKLKLLNKNRTVGTFICLCSTL